MESLEEIYPLDYLKATYFKTQCTQCSKKCSMCAELDVNRFYVKHNGFNVPTVIYKCKQFSSHK